jgi:hypothetical protein
MSDLVLGLPCRWPAGRRWSCHERCQSSGNAEFVGIDNRIRPSA